MRHRSISGFYGGELLEEIGTDKTNKLLMKYMSEVNKNLVSWYEESKNNSNNPKSQRDQKDEIGRPY